MPSWLLFFPDEIHGIWNKNNQKDLSIRMCQFFYHYLKGGPTPIWMIDRLPIWERPGEEGFKLMPQGVEPGQGLNIQGDLPKKENFIKANAEKVKL